MKRVFPIVRQAGVVLGTLDSFLEEQGYTVPLDLGAKGRYFSSMFRFDTHIAAKLEEM